MKQRLTNLIPPLRLQARQLRRRRRGWIVGLFVQGCLMVGITMAARQIWPGGSPTLAAELSDSGQQIARLQSQVAKQRKVVVDAAARQGLMSAVADMPNWSLVLKLIDQTVSDDITLKQAQVQESTDHQFNLSLRGIAQSQSSVTQFVLQLQQSGLFKDIRVGRSEREPFMAGSAISFEVSCPIDGLSGVLP